MRYFCQMKQLLILSLCILLLASCGNSDLTKPADNGAAGTKKPKTFKAESAQDGIIVFEKTEFDLGTIHKGEKVTAEYRGKNIGDHSVKINGIIVSCECMIAEYPKDPIHPGMEFTIKGTFDSSNMPESQYQKRMAVDVAGEIYKPSLGLNVTVVK